MPQPFTYPPEAIEALAEHITTLDPELRLILLKATSGMRAEGVDMASALAGLMLAYTVLNGLIERAGPLTELLMKPMVIDPLLKVATVMCEELRGPNP